MRNLLSKIACVCLLLAVPLLATAQSDVGSLTGTVTDHSGAVVQNASVELKDTATNHALTTTTNAAGQYTFSRVTPGTYTLTVKAPSFSTTVIGGVRMSVGRAGTNNVTLQLGTVAEVVEVQGGAAAELQTQDASVGAVITNQELRAIPNLGRDATGLMLLQPGAMPTQSGDENSGGQIMGARSDQNTFMLDGGDITNSTDGLGSYAGRNNFSGAPHGAVPTPVDSLEEFRVVTNNNMGGFNRSAGAEVQMVTRRGTNQWHGALYDYNIQDDFNAESWSLKHANKPKPEWRDNRFGGSIGGPIFKDRTFFFINVESRHFLQGNTISKLTPTATARQGTIGYLATDGTYKFIPIVTIDPLAIGLNQDVSKIWSGMPQPTPGQGGGDHANFQTFLGSAPLVTNSESVVGRLDHQITSNWHFMGSYRYGVEDNSTTNQTLMTATGFKSLSARPVWGNFAVAGLTGQLTQHLTNDTHFNFTRLFWKWGSSGDKPQLPGLGGALQLRAESSTSAAVPYNVDTQQSRQRLWDGKDYNLTDTLSWLHGKHMIQITGRYGWQRFTHLRNDKVTGGTTDPIYYGVWTTSGSYNIPGIPFPADMASSYKTNFGSAYVSMLGLITRGTQVLTRDGSLTPQTPGTWITAKDIVDNWEIGFNDAWKLTPSLTVSYGLTWSVELPPYNPAGTNTMEVDAATGKVLTVGQYEGNKAAALSAGQYYNPVIGFQPIKLTHRKYPFDPDYTNLGPRLAVAWNPSVGSDGIFGRIFGDKKTVLRAGWTRAFDRLNGVDLVMTPALGVGFADLGICAYPKTNGSCGGAKSTPTTGFRIGTNGNSITIPGLTPVTPPVVPGTNAPFSAVDWHIDPRRQVGSTDVLTFSIQRELPHQSMLEVGFVGRISRDLYEKVDLNNVPYMFKMGGQTFAQAFDTVQKALIAGQPVGTQPFFEAALGGIGSGYCSGFATCTAAVVANEGGLISHRDVSDTFSDLEGSWAIGNGYLTQFGQEVYAFDTTVSRGKGRYAGLYVTMKKGGKNLSFQGNYTLSKSLDSYGWNQDIIDTMQDAYNPSRSYGPSLFDRHHIFNGWLNLQLPFGRGQRWASSNGIVDKLIGGWGTSYVFTAGTGVPNMLFDGNYCGTEFGGSLYTYSDCSSLIALKSGSWNMSRHNSTTVTSGWGADSTAQSYPNAFANAGSIFNNAGAAGGNFRYALFSDSRAGNQNWLRGMGYWTFDVSLSKTTHITERVAMKFSADLINAFNHPNMADPSTDISDPTSFGVLTGTQNLPRYIQFGLRFDF
jgi:Carboxypeptidase regulatory-like domain